MFSDRSSLTSLDLSFFITINVKDMSYLFDGCFPLIKLDLSNFNTNKVENMICMFFVYSSLSLSNLNTKMLKI